VHNETQLDNSVFSTSAINAGLNQGCQIVPNLADCAKNHFLPKMPKFCYFLKYQLPVLTKQSTLDYLSNEYLNFAEKIEFNNFC